MSLFGTTSGFGTSGTSMFGSTTTDNHNPMKVPQRASRALRKEGSQGRPRQWQLGSPLWGESCETLSSSFRNHRSAESVCPLH